MSSERAKDKLKAVIYDTAVVLRQTLKMEEELESSSCPPGNGRRNCIFQEEREAWAQTGSISAKKPDMYKKT